MCQLPLDKRKEAVLERLKRLRLYDRDLAKAEAVELLLGVIGDPEIRDAYNAL
jgi:hypothetical protein